MADILINPMSSVYPTASGDSLGAQASPFAAPVRDDFSAPAAPDMASDVLGGAPSGKSLLIAGATFVALLIILMFAAAKLDGGDGKFSNIKGSFYNVLIIGLAAIAFIPLAKMVALRVKIPGISHWILAA